MSRIPFPLFFLLAAIGFAPAAFVGLDHLCASPCGPPPMAFQPWMLAALGLGITFLKVGWYMMPKDAMSEGELTSPLSLN